MLKILKMVKHNTPLLYSEITFYYLHNKFLLHTIKHYTGVSIIITLLHFITRLYYKFSNASMGLYCYLSMNIQIGEFVTHLKCNFLYLKKIYYQIIYLFQKYNEETAI